MNLRVFSCACVLLVSALGRAQESSSATNLGTGFADIIGNWLLYSVPESVGGRDLNGDGDTLDTVGHVRDLRNGEVTNLRLAGFSARLLEETHLGFEVSEEQQGADLNGDGDQLDGVAHIVELATGTITNLGVEADVAALVGEHAVLLVSESSQNTDLNGDGDVQDRVVHVHDLAEAETRNLGLSARSYFVTGRWVVPIVWEVLQGADLNGDGDEDDFVVHVHDLVTEETRNLGIGTERRITELGVPVSGRWVVFSGIEARHGSDLNGDGDLDDSVVHVHDLAAGETRNLRLSGRTSRLVENRLAFQVRESEQGQDLNGDGDMEDGVVHVHDLATGETTNVGLAGHSSHLSSDVLVISVNEEQQGTDLNGDDDRTDLVAHLFDFASGAVESLGLQTRLILRLDDWLILEVREGGRDGDLNGDGDVEDIVFHVHDLASGETRNLRITGTFNRFDGESFVLQSEERFQGADLNGDGDLDDTVVVLHDLRAGITAIAPLVGEYRALRGGRLFIAVVETEVDGDLNGDGDLLDSVLHVHDFRTGESRNLRVVGQLEVPGDPWIGLRVAEGPQGRDLNGDGDRDDFVGHVHDLRTGETHNLGLAGGEDDVDLFGDWLVFDADEGQQGDDLNGDGDLDDVVMHLFDLTMIGAIEPFLRGDCNGDGSTGGVTDAVAILLRNFAGGVDVPCVAACDVNADGDTGGVTDAVALLTHNFLGGFEIPPPFPACGVSFTGSDRALGCETSPPGCP